MVGFCDSRARSASANLIFRWYWYYYWTIDVVAPTTSSVTSSQVYTTTTVSVYANNEEEASSSLSAVSSSVVQYTPPAATSLQSVAQAGSPSNLASIATSKASSTIKASGQTVTVTGSPQSHAGSVMHRGDWKWLASILTIVLVIPGIGMLWL